MLYSHHYHPFPEVIFISQTESLYAFNNNCPLLSPPNLWQPPSTFCLYESDYSKYIIQVKLYGICPFVTAYFT